MNFDSNAERAPCKRTHPQLGNFFPVACKPLRTSVAI